MAPGKEKTEWQLNVSVWSFEMRRHVRMTLDGWKSTGRPKKIWINCVKKSKGSK